MKRLAILGIVTCLGLVFAPAAVLGNPAGPPGGLDARIVAPIPLPVEGDVNATVTGDVNVANTPDVNVVNDAANPVPVTVQPDGITVNVSAGYRFVGPSGLTTTGDAGGFLFIYKLCQFSYGQRARMCTTEEFIKSLHLETIELEPGDPGVWWIQPSFVATIHSNDLEHLVDFSGLQTSVAQTECNCTMWTHDTGYGTAVVYTLGAVINNVHCSADIPVACCTDAGP